MIRIKSRSMILNTLYTKFHLRVSK